MSKISNILEELGKVISQDSQFEGVTIYYDEIELEPNSVKFPCIQFQPKTWVKGKGCDYERPLSCRIVTNTKHKRQAILQLWEYAERLQELFDDYSMLSDFEMSFMGGSELGALKHIKKDADSYKSSSTVYGSIIELTYLLRY